MFGITARDTNGIEYGFAIDTVEQVRAFAQDAMHTYGTAVVSATYGNKPLAPQQVATLAYGYLEWQAPTDN
jgi:hypothetical protein